MGYLLPPWPPHLVKSFSSEPLFELQKVEIVAGSIHCNKICWGSNTLRPIIWERLYEMVSRLKWVFSISPKGFQSIYCCIDFANKNKIISSKNFWLFLKFLTNGRIIYTPILLKNFTTHYKLTRCGLRTRNFYIIKIRFLQKHTCRRHSALTTAMTSR